MHNITTCMSDSLSIVEIDRISVLVSVSAANVAANSRPTFGTLSVSAWCELYFGWSTKVSQRAYTQ